LNENEISLYSSYVPKDAPLPKKEEIIAHDRKLNKVGVMTILNLNKDFTDS
jgi:hypothetical protein